MDEILFLTSHEKKELLFKYRALYPLVNPLFSQNEWKKITNWIKQGIEKGYYKRDDTDINPLLRNISTILILTKELVLKKNSLIALVLSFLHEKCMFIIKELND